MAKKELRFYQARVEAREADDGKVRLVGHAAVFDQLSEPLGGFREKIAKGAFSEITQDVRAFWNHDSNYVLGRVSAGTLRVAEDDTGLAVEIIPPDTQWARDLLVTIERGDVREMSFAFFVPDGGDAWETDGDQLIRTLRKVDLIEVSPVALPAYPQTDISADYRTPEQVLAEYRAAHGEVAARGAIPYRKTPLADPGASWDGPAEVAKADVSDLRAMCAWVDPEHDDVKAGYKLPHHRASGEHPCVWAGVRAAMAALLGARGGVDIPDKDREAVYRHLAKHYQDFDKEPPDFRHVGAQTLSEARWMLHPDTGRVVDRELFFRSRVAM